MIILEQKYSGKDSHSMDFAHGRVDSIGDCCYCRRNRIAYFPGAVGGRRWGLNYSNSIGINHPQHSRILGTRDPCLPKDGTGIWVIGVDSLKLLQDLLCGAFLGITKAFFTLLT